jgi:hypothetical protein
MGYPITAQRYRFLYLSLHHIEENIVTWMATVLLSKTSISNRDTVFYGIRAATVHVQWFGERVSTIEAVFSVGSVQRSYLKNKSSIVQF